MSPEKIEGLSLLARIWLRISTPISTDEEHARREYMIRVILFMMSGLLLFFTLLITAGWLAGWFTFYDVLIMVAISVPVVWGSYLTLIGRWRFAGVIPALVFLLLGLFGSFSSGLTTTFTLAYAAAVILAGLLLGNRPAWFVVFLSLVSHLTLGRLVEPGGVLDMLVVALPFSGLLMGIATLQQFASGRLQAALDHTRQYAYDLRSEIHERMLAEEELHKANRELVLLNRVIAASTSLLEMEDILGVILRELASALSVDQGGAALLEQESGDLKIVAQYPDAPDIRVIGTRIPIAGNPSTQYVFDHRKPMAILDAQHDIVMAPIWELMRSRGVVSILILPLIVHDQVLGTIGLDSFSPRNFSDEEIILASNVAVAAAQAIENSRLYSQVQRLAIHDEQTDLLNRRGFFEFGRREMERSRRFNRKLSIIFLDLDLFKQVNDSLGHAAGDVVLNRLAYHLRCNTRDVDLLCRYGGDEFVILLVETDISKACEVAERMRLYIQANPIQAAQEQIHIAVSMGVAELAPEMDTLEMLIASSDQALYQAKQAGRNRVCLYKPQN